MVSPAEATQKFANGGGEHLDLFDNPHYSDIKIRWGDREIYAHKAILARSLKWFHRAFSSGFQETSSAVVVLEEDDPDAIYALLKSAYRSKHEITVPEGRIGDPLDFLIDVFFAADKYDSASVRAAVVSTVQAFNVEKYGNSEACKDKEEAAKFFKAMQRVLGPDANSPGDKSLIAAMHWSCRRYAYYMADNQDFWKLLSGGKLFDEELAKEFGVHMYNTVRGMKTRYEMA